MPNDSGKWRCRLAWEKEKEKSMKILALDSSGLVASVAVMEDDSLIAEFGIQYKKTHSQTLVPMMEEIRRTIDLDLASLDAVAVAAGPGSFTGLRIGSATAKGLGLALGVPLIEVPTLEGLAYNLYGSEGYVCPIMDARRGQVYTGIYEFVKEEADGGRTDEKKPEEEGAAGRKCLPGGYKMRTVQEQAAFAIEEIAGILNDLGHEAIFLGDGVPVFRDRLPELMETAYSFAPAHMNRQRAAAVAALAGVYYREGKIVSAAEHAPIYLRMSQAERERKEKEAGNR